MSSVKEFMVGNPFKPTMLIHYSQLPVSYKKKLGDLHHIIFENKRYYKHETLQSWSTCTCQIFHERYYTRIIKKLNLKVIVDRSTDDHINHPERHISYAGVYDNVTGKEIVKPIENWRDFL